MRGRTVDRSLGGPSVLFTPSSEPIDEPPLPPVRIAGRSLRPTPVFDTYWRFAAARQAIYLGRLAGSPLPWTDDEILLAHRFTNVFRASDRVSQYLIRDVISGGPHPRDAADVVFRILLFKIFNKERTWQHLEARVGQVSRTTYRFKSFCAALDEAAARGPIYSAAYLMPPPKLGEQRKHANHLRLLELMMRDGIVTQILAARSLREVYEALLSYPGVGPFLAFQYAIDLNYSDLLAFDENDHVVAGPGARDGIRKCFGREAAGVEADVIRYVTDAQDEHFKRLGLSFPGLFGRPLHLIDAQNLFCEVDKYARVRHPEIVGISGRSRIKQKFRPQGPLPTPVFPARWGLQPTKACSSVGGILDGTCVEVDEDSTSLVVSQTPPGGEAGENRPLPF